MNSDLASGLDGGVPVPPIEGELALRLGEHVGAHLRPIADEAAVTPGAEDGARPLTHLDCSLVRLAEATAVPAAVPPGRH